MGQMVRRVLLALLMLLGSGAVAHAVENGILTLKIIRAEVKTRDRLVYWVVNTPLYHEDPYFEVAVRPTGTDLMIVAEREPQPRGEMLPQDWKPGEVVEGRVDRHHLFLKLPNGSEMRLLITRRTKAPPE
jgi:hypothetical protein